ncbi:TRPM8 channel-associated factor homolog isoform X2 [Hyla sarda]|nr:TRPM8 channel-associated factor homolog isoform X2 [Hyla sarda]XP_056428951.1 TRPM8 channel-associated factor homolog isoform X2 [Hyla sarda]XP_056428952.1 TRPM8 channel-associated factor homolog isoform X2 [Hyla sarda]XP_056428953.1 TRPM8 channel-associated factor homolog isoform X2 [Hyla sarda]
MASSEDYYSLVKGIRNLDFSGSSLPCKLLLTGDTAFPVVVSPEKHVLIAASKYGKGRIVVMAHEAYLDHPQFMDFINNAVSWLKPSSEKVIGVDTSFTNLEQTLTASGHKVKKVSGLTEDVGVLCTTGYDDSQAVEIVSFLKEGGGLLIGARAWHWAYEHKPENALFHFPGNKITSVAGVYFTDHYGEQGNFNLGDQMPITPWHDNVDFSTDLNILLQGLTSLDISGDSIPSELLLHGPLTFPVGITDNYQCFFGAAYYGRGRILVEGHESFLSKPELKAFTTNAISWLDMGRKGKIGVNKEIKNLAHMLQNEGLPCIVSDLVPGLSVYCCPSWNDGETEKIQQFVAEGGGLLIGGQSWYWSYSNPDVVSKYPGNKILNKLGITILPRSVERKQYNILDPQAAANTYDFYRALCQLLRDLNSGAKLKPPLSSWLSQLRKDVASFLMLPASPLTSSIWKELSSLVQGCKLPNVSKEKPVKNCSIDAFILCLVHEISCLEDQALCNVYCIDKDCVTVEIDATNQGDDAWRSTGLYLPPRKTATLVFPASAVGKDLQVQVGCHSDELSSAEELCRAPVVIHRKKVDNEKVVISYVWGGLLYIIVKGKSQLGIIPVTVYGAEPAPTFIKGQTKVSSWKDTIRKYTAPWAELITENIILTVPSDVIRSLDDPEALLSEWNSIMNAIAELAMIPKKFLRPERIVADVQISAGWMHAGYPIMCHLPSAAPITSLQNMKTEGIWGPIHELGHNQQQPVWEFPPNTTEATCNLWSVYVHENVLGIPKDKAHSSLIPAERDACIRNYLKNGAKLENWNVWTALETYLQLQEGFGWDPFKQLFSEYQTMSNISTENKDKMNLWAEKFSQVVNKNLAPFFLAWGWPIDEAVSQKLSKLPAWEEDPMKTYAKAQ